MLYIIDTLKNGKAIMTSKEAIDVLWDDLEHTLLIEAPELVSVYKRRYDIVVKDLEVLDMIKIYYKQILLFYIKKQTSNTYFGLPITEQKKYEEHKQNLFKIKEWLEND